MRRALAAVDDRVACAVPCIGVQSFRWEVEHDGWHGRMNVLKDPFNAAAKSAGVDKPDAAFVRPGAKAEALLHERYLLAVSDELHIEEQLDELPPGLHRFRHMPLADEVARLANEALGGRGT